jgi:bifunctional non-homologous end joining protein LigD
MPLRSVSFIAPMLLLRTERLPDDRARWSYEIKLDGYRAIAFKSGREVQLRSRNDNDFRRQYPAVVTGLAKLPANTVIDGEIVALDDAGRPSFQQLQNFGSAPGAVFYFVFDVLVLRGRDVMREPLYARRALLEREILPKLADPVRYAAPIDADLATLVRSVREQQLEGLVAKRVDSVYEPGERSGVWLKMRIAQSQEMVIGGYTIGAPFDALVFGYYDDDGRLLYAGRTRAGFTPAVRADIAKRFKALAVDACPFANLPEKHAGRWGQGLTKAKMVDCRWLRPELVAQISFVEWTSDTHLRHSRFVALREDKPAHDVRREQ